MTTFTSKSTHLKLIPEADVGRGRASPLLIPADECSVVQSIKHAATTVATVSSGSSVEMFFLSQVTLAGAGTPCEAQTTARLTRLLNRLLPLDQYFRFHQRHQKSRVQLLRSRSTHSVPDDRLRLRDDDGVVADPLPRANFFARANFAFVTD